MRSCGVRWRACSLLLLVLSPATLAVAAPRQGALPLTRVRLYETGVGYFERGGVVPAGETSLPVPAGHLDDALKTLVVLGGDVKVSGVAFASSVSRDMARKLAGLPESGDAPLSFSELARSFKGAGVTLATTSGSFNGRLVEVLEPGQGELERCASPSDSAASPAPSGGATASKDGCRLLERGSLLILTAQGELRRVASTDVVSLRPSEPAARARLDAALDALSQRGAQTRRDLGVLSSTGGKVTLGYVAEAPVWRSTYRIVLGADKAKLQGWALLHNDTDEDWRSVQVDLVNGRPTSFLYPLAAPRYARRELVTPEDELHTVPQLFDTTVDNLWSADIGDSYGSGGIGLGGLGVVGHGSGGGGMAEGLNPQSSELDIGNLASLTPAEGVEAAALFRYTLPGRLALQAHGSALVPFLDSAIKVRQVAWFGVRSDAAASALHVTNDTKQTLPGGTLSVFGDGGFAGESLLPRAKPNESHLLSYGVDLDLELSRHEGEATEEPRLFAFDNDRLEQHYLRRRSEALTLSNRSQSARTVYVELDVVNNARVVGAAELGHDGDTDKTYTVLQVPAGNELSQSLTLEEGLRRVFAFDKLDSRTLRGFSAIKTTTAAQRAVLQRAAEQLERAESRLGAKPKREAELAQALIDIARIRENARILGAVRAKQVDGMAERIVQLEKSIVQLRTRIAELTVEADGFTASAKRELRRL
ncbi:MAG TPA: hypothetical protein VHP33_19060 [Polyangiaceae bacterium]|nr:hypothetical protein [Polyangiaceae bacterium]